MKERLDNLVVNSGLASDIKEARSLILAGKIIVEDHREDKCGSLFPANSALRLKGQKQFVSRGGLKLSKGLEAFNINVNGKVCLDIGASSGGFTDCLLQQGAQKVYAVDVAYGQLDWKIRNDDRVVVLERCNAKRLTPKEISDTIQLAVMDVSFISCTKIIPYLLQFFSPADSFSLVTLIKPQFELPKNKICDGGVVTSSELHEEAIAIVGAFCEKNRLTMANPVTSPIKGPKGNTEFLTHIHY